MHRVGSLLCMFGVSVTLAAACGANLPDQSSKLNSIIDQNTMVVIDEGTIVSDKLKSELPAVGKMTGGCTAFHIGHGIVATAGHCLAIDVGDPTASTCHNLSIDWNQNSSAKNSVRSRCMKILKYQFDAKADYAFVQVDPAPAVSIEVEQDSRNGNEQAVIIGYPKDKALSLSSKCEVVSSREGATVFFQHRCDTLPGNSGSPVLNANSSKVIGIHNGDANGQQNYGSYLPAPAELLAMVQQLEIPAQRLPKLQFGPFADQLTRNLLNVTSKEATTLSFDLNFDIEEGYDKLVLIDGLGRTVELTGQHQQHFEKLPTPISLIVVTDYSGTSQSVELSSIAYD